MPQVIVTDAKGRVVKKVNQRGRTHGSSMQEACRQPSEKLLIAESKRKPSFKEFLLAIPDVGEDQDFERIAQTDRSAAP